MGSISSDESLAKRISLVVEWLNSLFPCIDIPLEVSEEELKALLLDGTMLCDILNLEDHSSLGSQRDAYMPSERRLEKVRRFLNALEGMGLPWFTADDLEHGSISLVVDCLLSLKNRLSFQHVNLEKQPSDKWIRRENYEDSMNASQRNHIQKGQNYFFRGEKSNFLESRFDHILCSPAVFEQSTTTSLNHEGHNLHEVFQLKEGYGSHNYATKYSESLRSNGFNKAPTNSILGVINQILDECIEKKKEEIPRRVASSMKVVLQEIERRFFMQAGHIKNQNYLIKAYEEKHKATSRVIDALASGAAEEIQIVSNQLQIVKEQKVKLEESMKLEEQHALELMKERDYSDQLITELKHNLEITKNTYEHRCRHLETEAKHNEAGLRERINDVELLLSASTERIKELEAFTESKFQSWNQKENAFQNFVSCQSQSVKSLRMSSESIKFELANSQRKWMEEMSTMGVRLKILVDAAENYHTVLAENRKLYNEVQELKGNIRVYCRIRPFLRGQISKLTTMDYIGENGELALVNHGKDGLRMFKFNKIFSPTSTQAQVFLDIQPLIRSVLDGYNVCIFAYGQTGSGKTFTMSGPNFSSKEEWGVNYRALSDLFHFSQSRRNACTYEIGVQMVEIYNEQVRDLLSNNGSQKRLGIWSVSQPQGLVVPDASMFTVKSTSDVLDLMQFGQANRAVGSTALNERSSRSHSILTVHVRGVDFKSGSATRGCLHLIDLAGSERVDRSKATGDRLKEAQHINKSLSALGDVIFALSQKSAHVPYRNSKLTQVLQSSLGGQAKTLMLVQVNPDIESYSETLSTLMFAERVSGVELGAAKSNKEGKDIKDLIEQVAYLKDTVARKDNEIEQLLLKDRSTESPESNLVGQTSSSPSTSSFGEIIQQAGCKVPKLLEKNASTLITSSELNGKNSDASSQLSIFNGSKAAENCHPDDEIAGSVDEDFDGMQSDVSAGDLFIGEEVDNLTHSSIGSSLLSEFGRPSAITTEKIPKPPRKLPKLPAQRMGPFLPARTISVPKRTSSSQFAPSLTRQTNR